MTREEKKNFLLNQLPPNTDCYYVDGFINGFDCTYDAVLKDFEAEMKAKDEEIERLKEFEEMVEWMELNSNRSLCDYYNNKDNK